MPLNPPNLNRWISCWPRSPGCIIARTHCWPQLVVANVIVLAMMLVLEKEWGFHYEASKSIVYEQIELVRPDRRAELQADLEKRTGLQIKRLAVGRLDFVRDTANLKIYYDDSKQGDWLNAAEPVAVKDDDSDL
jgi:hypothetical protein